MAGTQRKFDFWCLFTAKYERFKNEIKVEIHVLLLYNYYSSNINVSNIFLGYCQIISKGRVA